MSHSQNVHRAALKQLGVITLALVALVGCEDEVQRPPATPPPATPPAAPPVPATPPPAPEAEQESGEYQRPEYPENVRRNPFQPDPEVVTPVGPVDTGGEETGTLTPIEMFTLNQLELTAIISEVAVPKAMFIDPSGFGHVVKEGDRIGKNKGVITDIRDNEVDVQETTSEGTEGSASRVRTLRLRDAELTSENQDDLTDGERQALEKLLDSEAGRRALRDRLRDQSQGASAIEGQQPPDDRFGGIEPPK